MKHGLAQSLPATVETAAVHARTPIAVGNVTRTRTGGHHWADTLLKPGASSPVSLFTLNGVAGTGDHTSHSWQVVNNAKPSNVCPPVLCKNHPDMSQMTASPDLSVRVPGNSGRTPGGDSDLKVLANGASAVSPSSATLETDGDIQGNPNCIAVPRMTATNGPSGIALQPVNAATNGLPIGPARPRTVLDQPAKLPLQQRRHLSENQQLRPMATWRRISILLLDSDPTIHQSVGWTPATVRSRPFKDFGKSLGPPEGPDNLKLWKELRRL